MTIINTMALQNAVLDGAVTYEGKAPAVLIEVERNGLSTKLADGYLSIEEGTPATTDAKFEIGSQSKLMTAAVVVQLASEGRLSLDDKLADIIDVAPLAGIANIDDVTLRQLMDHTSGIPDHLNDFMNFPGVPILWERLVETPPRPVDIYDSLDFLIDQNASADFAPGDSTKYSNTGYLLLQLAIEQATGNSLAQELQTRIFDPLGMASTTLPGFEPPEGIINSYFDLGESLLDVTHIPLASSGYSGVVSTTADMIKFMKALVVDATLIPEDYQDDFSGAIQVFDADGEAIVGHAGGVAGTTSITMVHLETGTVFSTAVTVGGDAQHLEQMFTNIIETVLTDDNWLGFENNEGNLEFALTAAELDVSETTIDRASFQTELDMGGVTLTLDGPLSAMDTDRLSFEDGSELFIATETGSHFSVRRDAREVIEADNQLIGLGANDRLIGGNGNDKIIGNAGNDRLFGRLGDDLISGGEGNDRLKGNQGNDVLEGGAGDDHLFGNHGADVLNGGSGQDLIKGGRGSDWLIGGEGDDFLFGGNGADTFVFAENAGNDTIVGFENGRDKIDLTALNVTFDELNIESYCRGYYSEIAYEGGSIFLIGSDMPLTHDDFLL